MIPGWVAEYIGLPFRAHGVGRDGVDCMGLCALVWQEQRGRALPDHRSEYGSVDDIRGLGAAFEKNRAHYQPVTVPALMDLILLRRGPFPVHVGLVVAPGMMLHIEKETSAVVEAYDGPVWRHRVCGFYRPFPAGDVTP